MTLICRPLTTNGDGSGTKNAVGNYASAATRFKLTPTAGKVILVERLIWYIEDDSAAGVNTYGGIAALSNGIHLRIEDDAPSTILSITDVAFPVKRNNQLRRFCTEITNFDTLAPLSVAGVMDFRKMFGDVLKVSSHDNQSLVAVLNDNFSGLVGHFFQAFGSER